MIDNWTKIRTWSGVGQVYKEFWCKTEQALTKWGGPIAQPSFQPVTEKAFPALPNVKVWLYIPGRFAT